MADPTVFECAGSCTVTVIHELSLPPLQLSASEGAVIASAVLAIWAIGWAFRQAIKVLNTGNNPNESES